MTTGKAYTFDQVVELFDEFLQTKSVHSVKSIKEEMKTLCGLHFLLPEDQNDFANLCSNFEKYCHLHKKTSFGRKQFEAAWESSFYVEDSLENAVRMIDNSIPGVIEHALKEDPLPEDLFQVRPAVDDDGTEWEPCRKAHVWSSLQCPYCRIQELNEENYALRKALDNIKKLLDPWAK